MFIFCQPIHSPKIMYATSTTNQISKKIGHNNFLLPTLKNYESHTNMYVCTSIITSKFWKIEQQIFSTTKCQQQNNQIIKQTADQHNNQPPNQTTNWTTNQMANQKSDQKNHPNDQLTKKKSKQLNKNNQPNNWLNNQQKQTTNNQTID